jgi:hypothetical protein
MRAGSEGVAVDAPPRRKLTTPTATTATTTITTNPIRLASRMSAMVTAVATTPLSSAQRGQASSSLVVDGGI